ncbi:zinc finger protein 879-like isoform X1 [Schistocerca gregaria]|uniref:zinc finger protein 879-like isoform X1 n=1 Tax=Schistocerca gregaria TaxID=7010 RepID=UPI00211EDEE6|nr:zinc finger protein 879-like isoform X1 [Schistocerca gregaria]
MISNKLCRLCAREREGSIRIYEEEGQKLNLATKIIQCLQIWLYPEDPLPKTVCLECCTKLNQYFDFFETSSRAQLSLQILFDPKVAKEEFKADSLDIVAKVEPNDRTKKPSSDRDTGGGEDDEDDDDEEEGEEEQEEEEEEEGDGSNYNIDGALDEYDSPTETNAEPPEFVECVLSDRDINTHNEQKTGSSASSRRKRCVPVKRTAPVKERLAVRDKTSVKDSVPSKSKNSVKERSMRRERSISEERIPLEQRLLMVKETRTEKKEKENSEIEDLKPIEPERNPENEEFCGIKEENSEEENMSEGKALKKKSGSSRKKKDGEAKPRPKTVMDGYSWQCTDCTAVLSSLQELRSHHQTEHNQPPNFKCSQCAKVYTRYRSFARHVKLHGNPKKFRCEECGKCFSQKTVLQSHSTVHTDARPHVCPQCGKAFKQFSSLYLHSKCHLPDQVKPKFPCDICHKDFATKHTLETHRKIHTGERNYICDVCGKSFIAKGSLDYHILTHSGEKPHHCPVCGKGFKTARLLGKHATLHTGIKPHQCDVCGKQFRERGALREHNRIHTGAMPYTCEFCGKNFRFKGILTVHRRQHTGERPYSCQECRREFTNWANYNKHMKRRHRNSDDPNALNTNRSTTRTYQAPTNTIHSSIMAPDSMKMLPQQSGSVMTSTAVVSAVPPPSSVSSLGGPYNLSSNHTNSGIGDSSSNSGLGPTGMPVVQGGVLYQNHPNIGAGVAKMSVGSMYGSHTNTNKVAVSNVFHNTGNSDMNHIAAKMPTIGNMYHHQQDGSQDAVDRTSAQTNLMNSYHVHSYVPAALPLSNMGYYIPPIHHTDPSMDMLHNRMTTNQ